MSDVPLQRESDYLGKSENPPVAERRSGLRGGRSAKRQC